MGTALATGWQTSRSKPEVTLVDPAPSDLIRAIAEEEGLALNPPPAPADIVVIAIKPQIFPEAVAQIQSWVGPETLVISIMAGIRLKQLAEAFNTDLVLRCLLYTSPSPRDQRGSRMPSSA